jgi:hypothetical protein
MNDMRKLAIWLLLIALPISSLAGAATSCSQGDEQAFIQETVVGAHAQHGSAQHGPQSQPQDAQDTISHHHVAQGDDSAPGDYPCCDHCVTMWVISGCGPAAITAEAREPSLDVDSSSTRLTDLFRVGPESHPLIRPPIPIN